MDRLGAISAAIINEFSALPILTQLAIVFLFVCGLIVHLFKYNEHTVHDGPSIFTTAGIFFTFLGIAEGLFSFDSFDIEKSVPTLLGGLKTAFFASVVGVGIALSIKLRAAAFGLPRSDSSDKVYGATIDDLSHQLFGIRNALIGQDDATLVSQLKLTRQDTNDRLDALRKAQNDFMEKMAENNSKALIEALKEVIRDFNTKISEQFGENFKQLNAAVGQLLEWQKTYREQLSKLIDDQTLTAENMRIATERYGDVLSKSESFAVISEKLHSLLEGLDTQRSQITKSLEALGSILVKASDSLPQIENKIIQLTEQVNDGVRQNADALKDAVQKSTSTMQQTLAEMKQAVQDSSAKVQATIGEMGQAIRNNAATIHETVASTKSLLIETVSGANKDLNAHVKQLSEKSTEQIKKLDLALEKEIAHSITTLASQLTALSKQFVDDYGPLTANLREIVHSARARA